MDLSTEKMMEDVLNGSDLSIHLKFSNEEYQCTDT